MKLIVCKPDGQFQLIADSALVLPGRPTFIPDLEEVAACEMEFLTAVKISRLGKSIRPKFATRFFDSATLSLRLIPCGSDGTPMEGIMEVMDFGLTEGEWRKITPEQNAAINYEFPEIGASGRLDINSITAAIVEVSRFATLKMGDTLLFPLPLNRIKAEIGQELSGLLNTEKVLHLRLK